MPHGRAEDHPGSGTEDRIRFERVPDDLMNQDTANAGRKNNRDFPSGRLHRLLTPLDTLQQRFGLDWSVEGLNQFNDGNRIAEAAFEP